MPAIELQPTTQDLSHIRSLCGYLGSFDPLHKGHEWIVEQLLTRFEAVLLLVPGRHFEKTVQFPRNATLEQRLTMLNLFAASKAGRVLVGLAHEVLFLRLADQLALMFPQADISFAMGNETFAKFLASARYYTRVGLPWTSQDQARLDHLRQRIVVFGRSGTDAHFVPVPEAVRQISSTQVRNLLREQNYETLRGTISSFTLSYILQEQLYTCIERKENGSLIVSVKS